MTLGGSLGRWTASSERKVTPGSVRTPLQWAPTLEQSPRGAAQCPAPGPPRLSLSSPPVPPPQAPLFRLLLATQSRNGPPKLQDSPLS